MDDWIFFAKNGFWLYDLYMNGEQREALGGYCGIR
jgi:hypothetical protein